jgi:hypothetical protein
MGDCDGNVSISAGPYGETIVTFAARQSTHRDKTGMNAVANLGVAEGAFVGDYVAADIVALRFKVKSDGHVPANFAPLLLSGSRTWLTHEPEAPSGTAWIQYEVGFDRAADGWHDSTWTLGDEAWAQSITAVSALGITLNPERAALEEQVYIIKDFMLVDSNGTQYPGNLSPLGTALWGRFGVASIAEVGAAGDGDSDSDGVSDLNETLVGTDADDPDSKPLTKVLEVLPEGIKIRWESAKEWVTYDVYRSTSMTEGFEKIENGNSLTLADVDVVDEGSEWVDETADPGAGPYFYKVVSVIEEE